MELTIGGRDDMQEVYMMQFCISFLPKTYITLVFKWHDNVLTQHSENPLFYTEGLYCSLRDPTDPKIFKDRKQQWIILELHQI